MYTSREAQNSTFVSKTKAPSLIVTYYDLQWSIDLDRVLIRLLAFQLLVSIPFFVIFSGRLLRIDPPSPM
jgi:hypothetical protein